MCASKARLLLFALALAAPLVASAAVVNTGKSPSVAPTPATPVLISAPSAPPPPAATAKAGAEAPAQETPMAFPASYTAADFNPVSLTAVATPTTAKSAPIHAPAAEAVTFTGVTFKVEDLPHTHPLPQPKAPPTALELDPSLPIAPAAVALAPTPTTPAQLAAFGTVQKNLPPLWANTSATTLVPLLQKVTNTPTLPWLTKSILGQLLTAQAAPPVGLNPIDPPWLVTRARALESMGKYEDAWLLWQGVPPNLITSNPQLAQGAIAAALMAGRVGPACTTVRQQATQPGPLAFWKHAALICPLLERTTKGLSPENLELAQSLAHDALPTLPPLLRAAVQGVLADKPMPSTTALPAKIDSLTAALLVAYPAMLTDNVIARLPDVALRRLARSATLPLRLRTLATEHLAEASGQKADADAVAILYGNFAVTAEALRDPIATARNDRDPVRARATLWLAALPREATPDNPAPPVSLRAAAWHAWFTRTQAEGLPILSTLLTPDAAKIPPDPTLGWLAPAVGRAAVLAGAPNVAWAWAAQVSPTAAIAALDVVGRGSAKDWQTWESTLSSTSLPIAARWLGLAAAGGLSVPQAAWQKVAGAPAMPVPAPSPVTVAQITNALATGQGGLAALLALPPQPAEDPAAPGWLEQRTRVLTALHLPQQAHAVAAQALLPASGYLALPPAPPVMNATAPIPQNKGKEIGAAPTASQAPKMEGNILLPPRVEAPKSPTKPKLKR